MPLQHSPCAGCAPHVRSSRPRSHIDRKRPPCGWETESEAWCKPSQWQSPEIQRGTSERGLSQRVSEDGLEEGPSAQGAPGGALAGVWPEGWAQHGFLV